MIAMAAAWTAVDAGRSGAQTIPASVPAATVMKASVEAAQRIERTVPGHRLALGIRVPTNLYRRQLTFGIAYALRTAGYHAEIGERWAVQLGPLYGIRDQPAPLATVTVSAAGGLSVQFMKRSPVKQIKHSLRFEG